MEKTHTSLEFSKWLQENGFIEVSPNGSYFENCFKGKVEIQHQKYDELLGLGYEWDYGKDDYNKLICQSYDILNDLCVRYSKELFGEESDEFIGTKYVFHTQSILMHLQLGEKEEAEKYIMEHSILNQK